jgi:hypothetical protein
MMATSPLLSFTHLVPHDIVLQWLSNYEADCMLDICNTTSFKRSNLVGWFNASRIYKVGKVSSSRVSSMPTNFRTSRVLIWIKIAAIKDIECY